MGRKATAKQAIITDQCRENRGDDGAIEEALRRLREEYEACREIHEEDGLEGVRYRLKLEVEYPEND